jgi:multiple sugar transport system permease protein
VAQLSRAPLAGDRVESGTPLSTRLRKGLARNQGFFFVLPWLVGFLVFQFLPFVFSLAISFTKWDLGRTVTFVGLSNYVEAFTDSPLFWKSVFNTVYYAAFHVPGTIVLAFVIAAMLNQRVRGTPLWRTMYYLPAVTSGIATAIIWIWLFQPQGIINSALAAVGVQGPNWLNSSVWAMPALIMMSFWGTGNAMVMFLAGLQGVPQSLYEAAMIDGAGWWSKVRHVTIPMMTPYIFMIMILQVIGSFQVFTPALVMTGGGPGDATVFIVLVMYWAGWQWFRMGLAAAIAWILLAVILAITVAQFRLARRWVYYEGEAR